MHRVTTCAPFLLKGEIIANFSPSASLVKAARVRKLPEFLLEVRPKVNGLPKGPPPLRPHGPRAGLRHLHARSLSTTTPVATRLVVNWILEGNDHPENVSVVSATVDSTVDTNSCIGPSYMAVTCSEYEYCLRKFRKIGFLAR